MTFNVEGEFLSLFVHGYKTAESRDSLVVANLALKQQPWVAIFRKAPPNPLDEKATTEHEDEMIRVKECLQGQHGFESQEECQWALKLYKCRGVCKWQNLGDCEGGGHLECAQGGNATIGLVVVRRGTIEIFRNCRVSGSERIKKCPSASELRTGSHKSAVY